MSACVEYVEGIYAKSYPLFMDYSDDETTAAALDMSSSPGNSYVFSSVPLQFGLTPEEFAECLRENKITGADFDACLDFFTRDRSYLFSSLERFKLRVFLVQDRLEKGLRNGGNISGVNWLSGGNRLFVSPKFHKKVLAGYVRTLQTYPNFEVGLVPNLPLRRMPFVSLIVKENSTLLANAIWPDVQRPLFIQEPTVVNSFYKYLSRMWENTPTIGRTRNFVIQKFEALSAFGVPQKEKESWDTQR